MPDYHTLSPAPWRCSVWAVALLCAVINCSDDNGTLGPIDPAPTAVVTDLHTVAVRSDRVTIGWTAPNRDEDNLSYEIRYAEESLTVANWYKGIECTNPPTLAAPGVTQSYDVIGLTAGKLTYIAVRMRDTNDSLGPISLNVSGVLPSLLAEPVNYDVGGRNFVTADLDSDGDLDIIVTGDNAFTLNNDGTGAFVQGQMLPADAGSILLARTGDFNNDGFADIAALLIGRIVVFTNTGMGWFTVADSLDNSLILNVDMQVDDFNGDGFDDIIILSRGWQGWPFDGQPVNSSVAIRLNDQGGGFGQEDTVITRLNIIADILTFDADADGDVDIAIYNSSNVRILYNDGSGRNWANYWIVGAAVSFLTAGDMDNDGRTDLIAAYGDQVVVALRSEQGGYTPYSSTPGERWGPGDTWGTNVGLGDFDADGFLDIARGYSALNLHLNDGVGGFAGAARYPTGPLDTPVALAVADFDGDSHPDVAVLQNTRELSIYLSLL